jgi:hypothetical protein
MPGAAPQLGSIRFDDWLISTSEDNETNVLRSTQGLVDASGSKKWLLLAEV